MRRRLTVILALSVVASSIFAPAALAKKPEHAAMNQADHWGSNCVKYDTEMGPTWHADGDYGLVVLKSARDHDEFRDVVAGDWLETYSGKDISHIIVCTGVGDEGDDDWVDG